MNKQNTEMYKLMSMNELRSALYEANIDYPDNANREDLIKLLRDNES